MRAPSILSIAWVALLTGCDPALSDDQGGDPCEKCDSVSNWDRPVTRPENEEVAGAERAACQFHRGAMPAETLGANLPVDRDIPIKHILVLMQENRSFDSYFGHLFSYGLQQGRYSSDTAIESAPDDAYNPETVATADSPEGAPHPWQHAARLCVSDTNHEWAGSHLSYDNGKMDGFFQANQGYYEDGQPRVGPDLLSGDRALWWYDERDLPFYYDLATTFAIGDHYHSSLLGPTYPNRDYLYAATSFGVTTGVTASAGRLGSVRANTVIFDELQKRGVSFRWYVNGIPHAPRVAALVGEAFAERWFLENLLHPHLRTISQFYDDAANGSLPQVAFIDGSLTEDVFGNDEHPPSDIQTGQRFVSDVVQSVFASPQWSELALFFTYDEHGGMYDHVAPPPACEPDRYLPDLRTDNDREWPGRFDRLGVRVPVVVISPFAKKSYVSHHVYDHTSITRFIEAKFKVPALTNRDANADAMYDFFDFDNPPFMDPPSIRGATVDQAAFQECESLFR